MTEITAQCGQSLLSSTDSVTEPQHSETSMIVNNAKHYSVLRRPPFTYTELIARALQEKGQLTLKEIYQWIS
jgi:hypothetical protein